MERDFLRFVDDYMRFKCKTHFQTETVARSNFVIFLGGGAPCMNAVTYFHTSSFPLQRVAFFEPLQSYCSFAVECSRNVMYYVS